MSGWKVLFLGLLVIGPPNVFADNEDPLTDDTVVIKVEGSHNLLLPNDWPVKLENGRYAPAPIEEYLSMKFGQVRTKFTDTDGRIDALEHRIHELESEQKALFKGLRALVDANQQEAVHGQ